MTKIKLAIQRDGDWVERGELNVEVVPRIGEVLALDEPGVGTDLPVGDFEVVQVKHYHFWQYPEQSEILVFLNDPMRASNPAV